MTEVKTEDQNASASQQAAGGAAVENKDNQSQVDLESKLNDVLATQEQVLTALAKAEEERDNYKNGMLAAKSKIKKLKDEGYDVDDDSTQEMEERIIGKVATLLDERLSTIAKPASESAALVEKLKKDREELLLAAKNRAQLPNASNGGGSQDGAVEVKTEFWTPEQLEYFKKNNLDPEEVKKRMTV